MLLHISSVELDTLHTPSRARSTFGRHMSQIITRGRGVIGGARVRSAAGPRRRRNNQGRPVLSIGFTVYCVSRILDILRVSNGKYRCKIRFKLQNSILIHGNLAIIADCNLYFGQNLYNRLSLIPKCIRFSPQITDNSLFSLFVTVKTANNTGFNLYGKYRLVLRR